MDVVLLLARLLLAAIFIVAAFGKLADRAGSRQAMQDFGVPARVAPVAGLLLPFAELAVAIALIPRVSAWWGAIGALVLLLAFVAGIGYNLARGRTPDCHCFGQLHSAPAGWPTLIRNGVLAAVAAFVIAFGTRTNPGHSAVAWFGDLSSVERLGVIAGVAGLAMLAAIGWLLVHLLGQNGRLLLRIDALETMITSGTAAQADAAKPTAPTRPQLGLPVGTPAPAFSLSGVHGETMTLDALRAAGKDLMLIFSDPNCGPCNALMPDIGRWQREHGGVLTVAMISRGKPESNRAKSAEHGVSNILLQQDREVAQAYDATPTPTGVLVRADGTIGSPASPGAEAIRALVASTVGSLAQAPARQPAAANAGAGNGNRAPAPAPPTPSGPAPAISLPDLSGKSVSLSDFKGSDTLVLFWNPGCGFCKRMVDDVKAWEAKPPKGAPKLLVVSTGTVEANQEMGFTSPVVLDEGFSVGRSFGASGTPSAVLVDAKGNLASAVAVGAPGVLALANGEDPATAQSAAPAMPPAPKKGDKAPEIKLPDLTGKTITLTESRGTKTLVLFWNPGCGFCNRMLDDLKAWEAKPPKGAPKLLVVSTGTEEANKTMGLRSPVVLDQGFNVGRSFGASGTPSAVLVDAKGKIASDVAVGAPGVLALAGVPQDQEKPVKV